MADEKDRSGRNDGSRKKELDDFWSFDDLLPKKRQSESQNTKVNTAYKKTEPVEISSAVHTQATAQNSFSDQKISFGSNLPKRTAPVPDFEYEPEGSLIHKVRVYRWESNYNYYEQFRVWTEKIFALEGKECTHVPYFSYVPQYNQLGRDQLAFYLWWRTCARRGKYIDADYSYVLLYIFETINLSGEHDYAALRDVLFGIWMAYRERYVRLDKLLSEWIFDFCMIHRLSPPKGRIPIGATDRTCGTAEFYVSAVSGDTDKYVLALLNYCTSYDYRKSKFYEGENAALYDRYVPSALRVALDVVSGGEDMLGDVGGYGDSKASREAYVGALCSCVAKKRIEIEFCSFSRSHELRYLVGDIVKYTENIIRSYIGVKSKLSVYSVSSELGDAISAHLKNVLPSKRRIVHKQIETSEFEKLYEAPKKEFSLADAKRIEDESWQTTKILIEAFDGDKEEEKNEIELVEKGKATDVGQEETSELASALGELCEYVRALLLCDNEKKKNALLTLRRSEAVIVDKVNETAADVMGDVIIDGDEGGYFIIEDYEENLRSELLQ